MLRYQIFLLLSVLCVSLAQYEERKRAAQEINDFVVSGEGDTEEDVDNLLRKYPNTRNDQFHANNDYDHRGRKFRNHFSNAIDLNFQNQGQQSSIGVSLPFLPLQINWNSRRPDQISNRETEIFTLQSQTTPNEHIEMNSEEPFAANIPGNEKLLDINDEMSIKNRKYLEYSKPDYEYNNDINLGIPSTSMIRSVQDHQSFDSSDLSGNLKISNSKIDIDAKIEENREHDPYRFNMEMNMKKKGLQNGEKENMEADNFSNGKDSSFSSTIKDSENSEDSKISGRFFGNALYSESTFDNMMRRLIKDHGKWSLDNQYIPSKAMETLMKMTERITSTLSSGQDQYGSQTVTKKIGAQDWLQSRPKNQDAQNTRKDFSSERGSLGTPFYVGNKESQPMRLRNSNIQSDYQFRDLESSLNEFYQLMEDLKLMKWEEDSSSSRRQLLLAFTSDGTPVNINIHQSIRNPLKHLHMNLWRNGLSLNFPINFINGRPLPVNAKVLRLGRRIGLLDHLQMDSEDLEMEYSDDYESTDYESVDY